MSVFAISDLHLALSVDKPMDIFGDKWSGYMNRLKANWLNVVKDNDWVILPGDISWATYISQATNDFNFIEKLPGKKILSKGNHDYWWTTIRKMERFLEKNRFQSISFMQNNSYKIDNYVVCGTRGWKCPGDEDFNQQDLKIFSRELNRLELSLKNAKKSYGPNESIIVAFHYPPFNYNKDPSEFLKLLVKYGVKKCIYGHLHGDSHKSAVAGIVQGIEFNLVSADYLEFLPLKL